MVGGGFTVRCRRSCSSNLAGRVVVRAIGSGGHGLGPLPTPIATMGTVGEGVQSAQTVLGPAAGLAARGAPKGPGGDACPSSSSSGEAFHAAVEGTGRASGEAVVRSADGTPSTALGRKEGIDLLRRSPLERRRRRRRQTPARRFRADDPPVSAGRGDERIGISSGTVNIRR